MTATISAPNSLWISGFMALIGSFVYLNSGVCTLILGPGLCPLNSWEQADFVAFNGSMDQKRFYHEDYEAYLNVFVIHQSMTDDAIKDILDNHNLFDDEEYLHDKEYYDKMARLYGPYIDRGGEKDRRFYCSYAGKEKGYGIYADVDIQKDTVIGVYTGMITNHTDNKDYAWVYASNIEVDGEQMDISIDSRVFGNFLRFVNHEDDPNTESVAVPYKNRWHRVYVAIRNIAANEEVTVSYGSNYWSSRDYIKV